MSDADRRAALVEKVAKAIAEYYTNKQWWVINQGSKGVWRNTATAAIDLIRDEVLEEAEDAVAEVGDCAEVGAYLNAIRALKETP